MTAAGRKGATRAADIPPDVLAGLNAGTLHSVNLTEWLAVDATKLLEAHAKPWKLPEAVLETAREVAPLGVMGRTERIAQALDAAGMPLEELAGHASDTVRCWAAYVAVARAGHLESALEAVQPFAADPHFGVREIAWMAWRPHLIAGLEAGLAALEGWTAHRDPNVRRFASETSRPRGVWCAHIQALKDGPALAERLLEPLRADPSKYVQTSVANWINDASKTQPAWAQATCERWLAESPVASTRWIANHALRTLRTGAERSLRKAGV